MSRVSAVGMSADIGRMHAATFRKCADDVQERDSERQAEDLRLRAGGLTAIERGEYISRQLEDACRYHSRSAQTPVSKMAKTDI